MTLRLVPVPWSSCVRRLAAASLLGIAALGAGGCGSTAESPSSAATAEHARSADHAGTPGGLLIVALGDVTLRPDQAPAVDRLRAAFEAQAEPARAARAKLVGALAEQVRAGKVDRARLQPFVDDLVRAVTAAKPAEQKALNDLHATLDAAQRRQLVAAMRDRLASLRDGGELRRHADDTARELGLTDAQRAAIRDQVRGVVLSRAAAQREDRARAQERMHALAAAFEGPLFDAAALDVGADPAAHVARRVDASTTLIEATLSVISAEQRAALADHILHRAPDAD